jgi:amino acid transporter
MATILTPPANSDSDDLESFGYRPVLHRKLGHYASFAAGFSFVSILTTIFQFFGFGYGFGGGAFFWTWPIVFAGQFLVALNFAELAARYPISGCVYQWSRRLAGEVIGWFAGWMMIIAQIVTAAAAAIALQVVLPSIWSGFQIIGHDTTWHTAFCCDGVAAAAGKDISESGSWPAALAAGIQGPTSQPTARRDDSDPLE